MDKQKIREEKAAVRELAKAMKKAEKEAAKAAKKAEKEAKKAEKKLKSSPPLPDSMPKYDKLDLLRSMAEEVYAELGAGHLESVYHSAMEVQLRLAGLQYESERVMDILFKGYYVGQVRADIILQKECVLEFKISGKIDDAVQQARQYMKRLDIKFGFVVLFPKEDGKPIQFVDARFPDALDL